MRFVMKTVADHACDRFNRASYKVWIADGHTAEDMRVQVDIVHDMAVRLVRERREARESGRLSYSAMRECPRSRLEDMAHCDSHAKMYVLYRYMIERYEDVRLDGKADVETLLPTIGTCDAAYCAYWGVRDNHDPDNFLLAVMIYRCLKKWRKKLCRKSENIADLYKHLDSNRKSHNNWRKKARKENPSRALCYWLSFDDKDWEQHANYIWSAYYLLSQLWELVTWPERSVRNSHYTEATKEEKALAKLAREALQDVDSRMIAALKNRRIRRMR